MKSLSARLSLVDDKVSKKLEDINNEANNRGILHSGVVVPRKIEEVFNILRSELNEIVVLHSSSHDRAHMQAFLDAQKQVLYGSFELNSFKIKPYSKLERKFESLSTMIEYDAKIQSRKQTFEKLKFWIPVVMSAGALIVSVVGILL